MTSPSLYTSRHPNHRMTLAGLRSLTLGQLVAWLQWNDPNGEYSEDTATRADALEMATEQLRGT